MKVLKAFNEANANRLAMPGEAFNEKDYEPEEVERLKKAGYIGEGSGFKPGEAKYEDMSLTDLKATAQAKGLDVESIRTKDRLIAAINAASEPYVPPAGEPPTERGVVNISKGSGTNVIESVPVEETPGANPNAAGAAAATAAKRPRGGAVHSSTGAKSTP